MFIPRITQNGFKSLFYLARQFWYNVDIWNTNQVIFCFLGLWSLTEIATTGRKKSPSPQRVFQSKGRPELALFFKC